MDIDKRMKKMKNKLIVLIICAMSLLCEAQDSTFYVVSSKDNEIVIDYILPNYQIIDTMTIDTTGIERYFSRIIISDNFDNKWYSDELDSIGMPLLPILSFDLNIPYNATNVDVNIVHKETETLIPANYIFPKQMDCMENDCSDEFYINESFYNSDSFFPNNSLMIDDYVVFGERGLTVSFMPFRYNPKLNLVEFIYSASIVVTFSTEDNRYSDCRNSFSNENYFENYFINYSPSTRAVEDNYLIITPPIFLPLMNQFKEYKSGLGYNVSVVTTNVTGTSAYSIKTYLNNLYSNQETRPDYVLLVGNTQYIPASSGINGNTDNPISDIEYSLFDGKDYKADIFIGRFPVNNSEQLKTIINKSIIMELSMNSYNQRVTLISGHGDGADKFKKCQDKAKKFLVDEGYNCKTIYATEGGSLQDAIEELDKRNIMYVFRGHGNVYGLNICNSENDCGLYNTDVDNSTPKSYPICISVACSSGNYAISSSFGNNWITSSNGGVAFFGATVNTYRDLNNKMHKKIFKNINNGLTLSEWINLGLKKFHNALKRRKLHIRAYNLLGDPSMKLGGVEYIDTCSLLSQVIVNNHINMNVNTRKFNNNNQFIIKSGGSVSLHASNEIILSDGFYATEGANFLAEVFAHDLSGNATVTSRSNQDMNDQHEDDDVIYKDEVELLPSNAHPSHISIYPSPANDNITIELSSDCHTIEIYDSFGRMMMSRKVTESLSHQVVDVDISKYPSGLYLVVVKDDNNRYYKRIVKN